MISVNDPDFTLHVGDAIEVLRELPAESVHCCVTSPPYWGLRDYSTEGQLGLEPTPDEYVANMVAVFREVRRVLRADGTLWLNIGDSYASGELGRNDNASLSAFIKSDGNRAGGREVRGGAADKPRSGRRTGQRSGLKPKDLVGIPWRLAFALQADGWYLRSDIIWSKPNPMPESVTDRPTKAHEYLFLLTKSPRYFYDADAIREPFSGGTHSRGTQVPRETPKNAEPGSGIKNNSSMGKAIWKQAAVAPPQEETLGDLEGEAPRGPDGRRKTHVKAGDNSIQHRDGERWNGTARNRRSVWEIATEAYPDAHFATFPQALVEPCVKAGCPEWVCGTCGKARERIVEREFVKHQRILNTNPDAPRGSLGNQGDNRAADGHVPGHYETETTGWTDCGHNNYQPGVVLDPFLGSGTTALVARRLGRKCVGIELNPEYAELCARRLQQLSLLAQEPVA